MSEFSANQIPRAFRFYQPSALEKANGATVREADTLQGRI